MKPKSKPPGTQRLRLKYSELLSILLQFGFNFASILLQFAFKFNLRCYTMDIAVTLGNRAENPDRMKFDRHAPNVRRCKLTR